MWIYTSNSFISAVAHPESENLLILRSRFPGHIEAAFPRVQVKETPECDYRYRASVPRDTVARWLARQVRDIVYDNFKHSIASRVYHDVCLAVWTEMFIWGKKLIGERRT